MRPLAACAVALLLQDPGEVLARYQLGGRPAVVTRDDVAVEMAFHLRRKEPGRQACELLVDSAITRREAERLGLMPSADEVRRFWSDLQSQLRAAGREPAEFPAVRNSTEAEWLGFLAVQLAQERLVRNELGLGADEPVSGDMLRLWIAERRKKSTIVTDPDQLPVGTAARVDGREVPLADLGLLLVRTSEDEERDRFVRQVVFLNSIEQLAAAHDITVDQTRLEAAIAARRAEAARDPRYRGLSFEQLLETQGMTVAALLQSRVFRAKVLQDLLVEREHPQAMLRQELARDRPDVLARVGARRHVGIIYRRAIDEPNALVPHDFESAAESLRRVRERLEIERFDVVARIETDDPRGKELGGDAGWHQRRSDHLPAPVLDAAFGAEPGSVVGPIRAADGCYLVKVLDVEPEPDDEELLLRLRQRHADELARRVLDEAKIELGSGPAKDGR